MIRLLVAATLVVSTARGALGDEANLYAQRALEVTKHIQTNFFDPESGVYFRSLSMRRPDYVWLQSVALSNLLGAARAEPATYGPVLTKYYDALQQYWDAESKVPGYEPAPTTGNGNDKYYDDNAWLVLNFLEAYEMTDDPRYLKQADATLNFVLSGWDDELGGGIWWHERHLDGTKNVCANGPAAVGCLRLAQYKTDDAAKLVEQARKIVEWTSDKLQDDDGLFDDRIVVATGEIKRGKLTYNSALMLRANLGLYRHTGEQQYLDEAKRMGKAADWFLHNETRIYRDQPRYAHFMIEADLELYRETKEPYLLQRAQRNVDALYQSWKTNPPEDLISNGAIGRSLWLMSEAQTDAGQTFWSKIDRVN